MTTARDIRNQIQYAVEQEVEQQLGQAVTEAKEVSFAEGHENGLAEGEKIGEARGIEETKFATAKKMLALGLGLDVIAQVTGFSVEALKDMKQN